MRGGAAHGHDALHAAGLCARGQCIQTFMAVTHAAQQHGQVHAGQQTGVHTVGQFLRDVAGRGAKHIGEQQDFGGAQLVQRLRSKL